MGQDIYQTNSQDQREDLSSAGFLRKYEKRDPQSGETRGCRGVFGEFELEGLGVRVRQQSRRDGHHREDDRHDEKERVVAEEGAEAVRARVAPGDGKHLEYLRNVWSFFFTDLGPKNERAVRIVRAETPRTARL